MSLFKAYAKHGYMQPESNKPQKTTSASINSTKNSTVKRPKVALHGTKTVQVEEPVVLDIANQADLD